MNDIFKNLETALNEFPKDTDDFNIICNIVYAEYKICNNILNVLTFPQAVIKREMSAAIDLIDDTSYNLIMENLNILNKIVYDVLPIVPSSINADILRIGDLLTNSCVDLLGVIPESAFNMFQDFEHDLLTFVDTTRNLINTPSEILNSMGKSLLDIKDRALKEVLGVNFNTILNPLMQYEQFLISNDIHLLLDKMKKIERCMTKNGICNRDKRDFIHPTAKTLYSTYYVNQFMINSNGQLNLNLIGNHTSEQKSRLHNILTSVQKYRN